MSGKFPCTLMKHNWLRRPRYGTYQQSPEEPLVGSATYPASIYHTWDPNWRGFVGTTFVMALEEFPKLITKRTQELMLESLHNATKGDEYRFGNLDPKKDNLYPSYSNPVGYIPRPMSQVLTSDRLSCGLSCLAGLVGV